MSQPSSGGAFASILARRCPRCRDGVMFTGPLRMNATCPACGLRFDRGDPGYFTGAMYVSYGLAVPLIAVLTLVERQFLPGWSILRLVLLAWALCVPAIPWIWQYSRVIWANLDRVFDPE